VSLNGSTKDFKASGQDGLGETLGMKVDAKRRIMWVVSDSFAPGEQLLLLQRLLTTGRTHRIMIRITRL
jgi:hypothetical protein